MRIILFFLYAITFSQCTTDNKQWTYLKTISLGETTPIGLTLLGSHIWIADGDHNQLVHIDTLGEIIGKESDFKRPMHLDADDGKLYVPEYGRDQITIVTPSKRDTLALGQKLDAPASVNVMGNEIAIADFYNHQVLYGSSSNWITIGQKGKEDGQFEYPTDVQITDDRIYVADAYNNRVQIFDKTGKHILSFGKEENMNAATGLYVSTNQVFVTDFENDRVIVYNRDGELQQIISDGLDKPTDILMVNGQLWIANYKGKSILTFKLK